MRPILPQRSKTHKAYSISAPLATHWRKATCQEIDCKHYREGWTFNKAHLNAELWRAIETAQPRRRYREVEHAGQTYLVFYPGQSCFATHKVRIEREELFFVTPNATGLIVPAARQHKNWDDWQDDFASHQDRIATQRGQ